VSCASTMTRKGFAVLLLLLLPSTCCS
jgi:hypothetical protein